jgi:predicted HAD superfamily phosphohydrolase
MTDFVGKGGSITPNALIESVSGTEVTIADAFAGVLSERTGVGSIVVVGDSVADDELGRRLTELGGYDVVMAGDCLAPRLLESAVLEGHRVGRAL